MRITCPTCETSYQLADGSLGATGRKVRCTRCGNTWQAMPGGDPPVDEAVLEDEWEAAEKAEDDATQEDDWKAALAETEPEADAETDFDAVVDFQKAKGEAETDAFDEGGDDDGSVGNAASLGDTDDDLFDPQVSSDALVPVAAVPETIDADPPGFGPAVRTRPKASVLRRKVRVNSFSAKLISGLMVGLAFAMVLATVGGALFAREAVVRLMPDLAGLYSLAGLEVNLRGLAFKDTRTFREIDGASPVLVVDGTIENVSQTVRPVPLIRFSLKSTSGREVYAWTMEPVKPALEPGETMFFRSRLPAPPEAATDVQVRFTDRRGP